MAGYDLDFVLQARYRDYIWTWLRFFKRRAATFDLEVHYQTRRAQRGRVSVYVTVDGNLPAIQHLQRQLPEGALQFLRVVGKPSIFWEHVLKPFLRSNEKGVGRITEMIFRLTKLFGETPVPLAISTRLIAKAKVKRNSSREGRAIGAVIIAMDGWLTGSFSPEQAVILADHAMENWLKARLLVPTSSGANFPAILQLARQNGLISGSEAFRLRRLHLTRNRIQHQGGRVRQRAVLSMFSYCTRVMDSH